MNDALWDLLTDEEIAEQSDQWRYASERARRERKFARAQWCRRMMISADEALAARYALRESVSNFGRQLALDVPGRIPPEERGSAA